MSLMMFFIINDIYEKARTSLCISGNGEVK